MNLLPEILWRNQGQILTPELISGILHGADFTPDNSIDVAQFALCEYKGYPKNRRSRAFSRPLP